MLLKLTNVLNQLQLQRIDEILARASFQDGKLTAGMIASRVKDNQELKAEREPMEELIRLVIPALANHRDFNAAALPMRMADPIVARYQSGNHYGLHVDDAIMGHSGQRFRSDISMTLFLRDPASYAGGELVIQTAFGDQQVKLAAGDAVIYPSSSLHRVAPVTSGERLVMLFWIQSHVRDPARRELLFDLNRVRENQLRADAQGEDAQRLDRSFANLMRMWADV